jgi:hypothetical protein
MLIEQSVDRDTCHRDIRTAQCLGPFLFHHLACGKQMISIFHISLAPALSKKKPKNKGNPSDPQPFLHTDDHAKCLARQALQIHVPPWPSLPSRLPYAMLRGNQIIVSEVQAPGESVATKDF